MEEEISQTKVIAFLMNCLHQIQDNMQLNEPELVRAYEAVLRDLREFDY